MYLLLASAVAAIAVYVVPEIQKHIEHHAKEIEKHKKNEAIKLECKSKFDNDIEKVKEATELMRSFKCSEVKHHCVNDGKITPNNQVVVRTENNQRVAECQAWIKQTSLSIKTDTGEIKWIDDKSNEQLIDYSINVSISIKRAISGLKATLISSCGEKENYMSIKEVQKVDHETKIALLNFNNIFSQLPSFECLTSRIPQFVKELTCYNTYYNTCFIQKNDYVADPTKCSNFCQDLD